MIGKRVHLFISYAHADREVVERLATHLRWLEHDQRISIFDDSNLVGGDKWGPRLLKELGQADIIILVVTADFTASHYCNQVELRRALARSETEGISLLPVLAAPCDWEAMPITDRQALPKDAKLRLKPIVKWGRAGSAGREDAFTQIAKHVRQIVERRTAAVAGNAPTPTNEPTISRSTSDVTAQATAQAETAVQLATAPKDANLTYQLTQIEFEKIRIQNEYLQSLIDIQRKEIELLKVVRNESVSSLAKKS